MFLRMFYSHDRKITESQAFSKFIVGEQKKKEEKVTLKNIRNPQGFLFFKIKIKIFNDRFIILCNFQKDRYIVPTRAEPSLPPTLIFGKINNV